MSNLTFTYTETTPRTGRHGDDVTRFTCDDTGAWIEIQYDDDAGDSPIENGGSDNGIAIAFLEGQHYRGTADDVPRDLTVECSHCDGSGCDPERYEVSAGWGAPVTASGSESAMTFLYEQAQGRGESGLHMDPAECVTCKGTGTIEVETVEEYLRIDRGALGVYVFDTGNRGEATAHVYTTEPQGAAEAWGKEYKQWAEGDVWGIVTEDGDGDCWGFIGQEHAEAEALGTLQHYVDERRAKRDANIELGYN